MRNKKGIAVFTSMAFILLALLGIYLILHLPIPAFASIKNMINYFLVLILWIALQVGFIYGYFYLGKTAFRGVNIYKSKLQLYTVKIKDFMLIHH